MFDITFYNKNNEQDFVYQNSWGLSTRSIGVMVMTHGDDFGLVLPPLVAPIQAVIIPIYKHEEKSSVMQEANFIHSSLLEKGIRSHIDDREMSNAKKFYHWEIKGVPLRIEIGMRDIKQNRITIFRRDRLSRQQILKLNIGLVSELLTQIQKDMYTKAKLEIEKNI